MTEAPEATEEPEVTEAPAELIYNGLKYAVSGSEVTIIGYVGDAKRVSVPATIEGMNVTAIGSAAFKGCETIVSVNLSDKIKTIGASAFAECKKLESINLPEKVKSIGSGAFDQCADSFVATVEEGSYAHDWCKSNGVEFEIVGGNNEEVSDPTEDVTGTPLAITTQPQNVTVADGATASTKVVATGDGLSYKWYYTNNGSSYDFLVSSTTGSTYSCVMNSSRDGRQIYCQVTDQYGNSVNSNIVTLKMAAGVKITSQPQNVTVAEGETASATVVATGDGLTYKWYYKDTSSSSFNLSSNTTKTYSCTMSSARNGRKIYCVVGDKYGNSVTSNTVTLSMKSATSLKIVTQPVSASFAEGATASATVVATGEGLKYQWYYKDTSSSSFLQSSNTTATYTCTMSSARNGRQVYCKITDANGTSVKTNTVTLSMKTSTTLKITSHPQSVTVAEGATASATVVATGDGLTYKWYYKDTSSSSWLVSSNTTKTYSCVMSTARNGRQIYCVVSDSNGNSVTSNTATLSMIVGNPLKIVTQPQSVTVASGETASVTVVATGDGLKYQWYYTDNGNSTTFNLSSNTTATYSTTMSSARAGRKVYCKITDQYGNNVSTNIVTLGMKAASTLKITSHPQSVTVANGETASATVVATGDGLTYKWYYKDTSSSSFLQSSNTTKTYTCVMSAARDGRQIYCVVSDSSGNKVTSNTATLRMKVTTPLAIVTQPQNVTVKNGETASVTVVATGDGLKYQWYYTDNGNSSTFNLSSNTTATYSTTMSSARAGRKVYCKITDSTGAFVTTNIVTLDMEVTNPLVITQQPTDVKVPNGATAKVTVVATGDGLSYKWYYKDTSSSSFSLSSTTTNTYSTTMSDYRNGRQVYCVITDKYGDSVTSRTATLSMDEPLTIVTQPVDTFVANGATVNVTVVAKGSGLKYQWWYRDVNADDFVVSSTTSATYTTTMSDARCGRELYCVVTDASGASVTSDVVVIGIKNVVKILTQPQHTTVRSGEVASVVVKAVGDGLTYKWYYTNNGDSDEFLLSSTTTALYTTTMNATRDGRQLYCVITDKNGYSATTDTVTLSLLPDGLTYTVANGEVTITGYTGSATALEIPKYIEGCKVTAIANAAFQNKTSLTSIKLPTTVKTIGNYAFSGCDGLTSFVIPSAVTTLSEGIFANCDNLTTVTMSNRVTVIGMKAFYYCTSLTTIKTVD